MATRLCLPREAWPEQDLRLWLAGKAPGPARRFTAQRPADRLAQASLRKTQGGYSRWLGFLAAEGQLDASEPLVDRVTPARVAAWVDALRAAGNRDYTVVGRLEELRRALGILAPGVDFGWLTRPGGVPVRSRLAMRKRSIAVHHPKAMLDWGLAMVEAAKVLPGPDRRRVMLRDGVLIALLAARAPRLRSLAALRLGVNVQRGEEGWVIDFGEDDIKTGKPLAYALPPALAAALDRYIAVERAELLAGRIEDALWIDWSGKPMRPRGIEKRIRWWSAKRFGEGAAFGPHRFRYGIGTCGPIDDPEAPGASAAVLGITGGVHRAHYDRGARAAAATRFQTTLGSARAETAALARNLFAERRGGVATARAMNDTAPPATLPLPTDSVEPAQPAVMRGAPRP